MARNLWKVIQKQEKKIEELESIVTALQLRIACLEARDVTKTPYRFDKFDDRDWWKQQPVMSNHTSKLDTEEIEKAYDVIQLVNKLNGGKK